MRRGIALILAVALVASLGAPVALAKGNGGQHGKGQKTKVSTAAASSEVPAQGKEGKAARDAQKAERKAAKAAAKEQKAAEKAARKAVPADDALVASDESTESVDPTESVEPTVAPAGPGVSNAFTRITANLEKSLAKIAAGKKKQLPPGLVRVWLKFASWLGVDPSTMPGATVGSPAEPTSTVEPTTTVEPTGTVEPTETVEPTVEPTSSIAPPDGVAPTETPAL